MVIKSPSRHNKPSGISSISRNDFERHLQMLTFQARSTAFLENRGLDRVTGLSAVLPSSTSNWSTVLIYAKYWNSMHTCASK